MKYKIGKMYKVTSWGSENRKDCLYFILKRIDEDNLHGEVVYDADRDLICGDYPMKKGDRCHIMKGDDVVESSLDDMRIDML